MARRKKAKKTEEAEVPMSSMIDVVFLLLIYFIVTQKPVIEETLLGVNLPSGAQSQSQSDPGQLFSIDVVKMGTGSNKFYNVNGMPTPVEAMKDQLLMLAENDPDTTVIIKCGPNAKHEKLITVLDACAEAGLTKLNLVELPIAYQN